jgi:hypothetical protein
MAKKNESKFDRVKTGGGALRSLANMTGAGIKSLISKISGKDSGASATEKFERQSVEKANKERIEESKDKFHSTLSRKGKVFRERTGGKNNMIDDEQADILRDKDEKKTAKVKALKAFTEVDDEELVPKSYKEKAKAKIEKYTTKDEDFTSRGKKVGKKIGDQGGSPREADRVKREKWGSEAAEQKRRLRVQRANKEEAAFKNKYAIVMNGEDRDSGWVAGENMDLVEKGSKEQKKKVKTLRIKNTKNKNKGKFTKE